MKREVEGSDASPDHKGSSYFPCSSEPDTGPLNKDDGRRKTRATQVRMLNKERDIGGPTEREEVTGYRVKPNVGEGRESGKDEHPGGRSDIC